MPQTALEFRNLSYHLPQRKLLEDFCLSLEPGEKAVICGPSGCGKSTLLKFACGLTFADSGLIFIEDNLLSPGNVWRLRRRMSFMQQESPVWGQTVREYLQTPFAYRGNNHLKYDDALALELAREFLLKDGILGSSAQELSGGERQRVALLSALLLRRPLLLLDEPCAGLDPESAGRVINYLKSRDDLTILAVAHDQITKTLSPRVLDFGDYPGVIAAHANLTTEN